MTGSGGSPASTRRGSVPSPNRVGVTLAIETNLWAMHRDFARVPGAEIHD